MFGPEVLFDGKPPKRLVPENVSPPYSSPHRGHDGDDLKTVARSAGIDVLTLMEFNFQTRDPDEILWYLREYMGRPQATPDQRSWKLGSELRGGRGVWREGVIWVPRHGVQRQDFHFVMKMNKSSP